MATPKEDPNAKVTRPTPSGGSVTMKQSDWDRFDKNFEKSANVDSPSVYSPSGERIPSGAETQAARVSNIGRNAEAISNWRQQEEIRKGQGAQVGGPVNMFGQPVDSFFVKADPTTGRTPIPELKPMPSFGGKPDFIPKFPDFLTNFGSSVAASQFGGGTGFNGGIIASTGFGAMQREQGEMMPPPIRNQSLFGGMGYASAISGGPQPASTMVPNPLTADPRSRLFGSSSNGKSNLYTGGAYLSPAIEEREKQARSSGLGFEMSPFQQMFSGFNRQPTRDETSTLALRRGIQNLPALGGLMGSPAIPLNNRTMVA